MESSNNIPSNKYFSCSFLGNGIIISNSEPYFITGNKVFFEKTRFRLPVVI
jgi:hypothetical protein